MFAFSTGVYTHYYSGGWMTFSLGRNSSVSGADGQWETAGRSFNWGSIDAARITVDPETGKGPPPYVLIDFIQAIPQQRTGAVAFVFDDGYESILPAAQYLHQNGMPADVAAIGKVIELPWRNYLNIFDLKMLQNEWGWDIVNHTQKHLDAVTAYYDDHNLGAYEQDILDGATFLKAEGLDSAPNWFIYPRGTTNDALDKVVGRFYTFARTVDSPPEAYPYGSPLRIKTLEVHSAGDVWEGNGTITTPPGQVIAAARDALHYHTTLILTFHRIHALKDDRPGYPIAKFEKIVDGIKRIGIPVMTLSQLDAMDGVPEDSRIVVRPAIPPLITVRITDATPRPSLWARLRGLF